MTKRPFKITTKRRRKIALAREMRTGDSDTQKIKTLQPGMREKTNGQRNESLTLAQIQKTTPRSDKHEARRYVNVCFENVYSIISKNVTFFSVKMSVY